MAGESVVGPWAETKLNHLADYLSAYHDFKGQTHWCSNYIYVDAFAGPGKHQIRSHTSADNNDTPNIFDELISDYSDDLEQASIIDGSPRRALSIKHQFTEYLFIEKSVSRVARLHELKNEFTSAYIRIEQGECAGVLSDFVKRHNWRRERAFVFLDPFGMQVNWDLIVKLAQTQAIEILLNFPVGMAIQRLMPRDVNKLSREMLDHYFGTTEWFDAMYAVPKVQPIQMTMFDCEPTVDDTPIKVPDSGKKLVQWYRGRLAQIFKHVSNAGLVRNSRNCPLYFLIHASPNAVANKS